MRYSKNKIVTVVLLLAFNTALPVQAADTLTFGIVPQFSEIKLARQWNPILRYLGEKSGYRLIFKPAPNIPGFEQRLFEGMYDLAYMNPYHYVVASRYPGYVAIAKQTNKSLQGILVVHKNSNIRDIRQLAHKTLIFPSEAAFAASILPRAELRKAGISIQAEYISSHDKVYRKVAYQIYPAGGGIIRTLNNIDSSIRSQLRILWKSKSYTPHAFAAHPDVDPGAVKRIQDAMLQMSHDPEGRKLLQRIEFDGIEIATDKEWDDIRKLDIKLLDPTEYR